MKIIYKVITFIILIISFSLAMKNPSAVYCEEMGYTFEIEETPEGQRGLCVFPDNSKVSAWEFLRGEVGQEYNYCTQQGYESRTINDGIQCSSIVSSKCNVCVIDGKETEVTELMGLDFSTDFSGEEVPNLDSSNNENPTNNLGETNNPETNNYSENSKLKWGIIIGLGIIILIFLFLILRKRI